MSTQGTTLYNEYGIDRQYDDQDAYGIANSYYGNGKYPPDWDARRDAVWDRQKYQCGRCRTYKGDTAVDEVHHVVHLANGGSNRLENLVGLCGDCHALMHPDVDELRGVPERAPVFPDRYAEDRVAVLREPDGDHALETDMVRLGTISSPDANEHAITSETVPTSATVAKRAESDLCNLLVEHDYVPRTSDYHRVRIVPAFTGYRGVVTSFTPEVSASSDGAVTEREWTGGNDHCDLFYTPDASKAEIELQDGVGETTGERLWLTDHEDGSRFRLERTVTPPPITLETAPQYAVDTASYVGLRLITWGILPALLLAFVSPSVVPFGGSVAGLVTLVLLVGFVLRLPWIARDVREARNPTGDRTLNERSGDTQVADGSTESSGA